MNATGSVPLEAGGFPRSEAGGGLSRHGILHPTVRAATLPQARVIGWDRSALCATILATLAGVIALVWAYKSNWILNYSDAVQHMNIARRVLDNRTPGIAQLGTVWLPLPHLLMLPFIIDDGLWQSGLAGSLVGLPCFVVSVVMLFQTVRLVVRHEFAAWSALLIFITNPNALYLQATALTEPVLFVSLTTSTYYLVRWSLLDSTADLIKASLFALLAVGSRYDGWFFALTSGAIIGLTTLVRSRDVDRTEGMTLAYLALPVFGMFLWLFYNWLIFGDALAFQHGKFSAAFQQGQFADRGLLPTKSHLLLSVITYSGTALLNLGSLVSVLAVTGLLVYIAMNKLRPESFAAYSFLSAYVFNVLALYMGQTIISTPISDPPGYFNARYGLVALPAAAFMIGYLGDCLARRYKPLLISVVLGALLLLQIALWAPNWPMRVVTIAEGLYHSTSTHESSAAALWLKHHYDGGGILYDDQHSVLIQAAGINMQNYYLSGPLQTQALSNPAHFAKWIVLAPYSPGDTVNVALRGDPYLIEHYALRFTAAGYDIYRRIKLEP